MAVAGLAFYLVLPAPSALPADCRAPARHRRLARLVLFVSALVLVLAGCSTNSGPKSFDDLALIKNVNDACTQANPEKKDVPDAVRFCDCVYAKIRTTYTFDEFKVLDSKLKDAFADEKTAPKSSADLAQIDTRYVGVVDSCRTSGPAAPVAATTTTTTTATAATTTSK